MESNHENNDQLACLRPVLELEHSIKPKSSVLDKSKKTLKYIVQSENIDNYTEPLYPDVTMIYPMDPWTFWFTNPMKLNLNRPWEESLIKIETVRDITRLWKVLNIITQPSIKHLSTSLFVFKENSIPAWEHESNENAGRWIIMLDEGCNLHTTWNDMVLQVVGDKFASVSSDINGIGLHIKPGCSKISVWTAKTTLVNYKNIVKIGVMTRNIIGPSLKRITYFMHNQLGHKKPF